MFIDCSMKVCKIELFNYLFNYFFSYLSREGGRGRFGVSGNFSLFVLLCFITCYTSCMYYNYFLYFLLLLISSNKIFLRKKNTRLMVVYAAESFESMELIITIISISVRLVVIYRMPPSKENKILRSSFITEFDDYVEKLSCLNCRLIIVGDFNINWWIIMILNVNNFICYFKHLG